MCGLVFISVKISQHQVGVGGDFSEHFATSGVVECVEISVEMFQHLEGRSIISGVDF